VSFTTTTEDFIIHTGSALEALATMPENSIQTCVTSPPYFQLRDFGSGVDQLGMEKTPEEFIEKLVEIFRAVRRVLRPDGTLWVNIGDSYATNSNSRTKTQGNIARPCHDATLIPAKAIPANCKTKDLIGIPWMLAFALRKDGWYLRSEIIWHKPAVMPESVKDRPTRDHEQIFLLTKSEKYYYDAGAISEPCQQPGRTRQTKSKERAEGSSRKDGGNVCTDGETRNKRSIWSISPSAYKGAHFATYPPELPKICIQAGASKHGCCPVCFAVVTDNGPTCKHRKPPVACKVLDPFSGSGTTGAVAIALNCAYQGIEINPEYVAMSHQRLKDHLSKPQNYFSQASIDDLFE
jgi:DNA modification methylase